MLIDGADRGETFAAEGTHAYWLFIAGRLPQALDPHGVCRKTRTFFRPHALHPD